MKELDKWQCNLCSCGSAQKSEGFKASIFDQLTGLVGGVPNYGGIQISIPLGGGSVTLSVTIRNYGISSPSPGTNQSSVGKTSVTGGSLTFGSDDVAARLGPQTGPKANPSVSLSDPQPQVPGTTPAPAPTAKSWDVFAPGRVFYDLPPAVSTVEEDPDTQADTEHTVDPTGVSSGNKFLDPIVLNLSGHAVHTTNLAAAAAHFDITNSGTATHTGWITTDEGFLVIAPPAGQAITQGSQLLPTFVSLAQVDTNHDGKLDSSDAGFANLRIWQNSTDDGVFHTDQLHTLAFEGVKSINLGAIAVNAYDNGNFVIQDSSFTYTDNTIGDVASVLLNGGTPPVGNTLFVTSTTTTLVMADGQVIEAITGGTGRTYDAAASGVSALVGGAAGDTFTAGSAPTSS